MPLSATSSERALLFGAAGTALVVGVAAFAFRYLTISPIENDHFVMLARAQQVVSGDWPVRDFEDPGQPLFYLLTAAAAALFGAPVLATNVVLCILLQAVAASCTYVLARRASGSPVVGIAAAVVAIVSSPRLYNTTKIIVPVVAIVVQWRYADRPDPRRLFAIAGWTAVAFLLRHDYAVYVAASTIVLLAVQHRASPRAAVGRVAVYGGVVALLIAPWLAYVQWGEGLGEYASGALRFVASEGRRTEAGGPQASYYLLALLPLGGLWLAVTGTRRPIAAHLASTSVLVLMMNAIFLRDVLLVRLPDVIAPTAVLAAAVIGQLFDARAMRVGALIIVGTAVVFTATSLTVAGYRIPTPMAVVRQTGRVTARLLDDSPDLQPSPRHAALVSYLTRCTAPRERVFVAGFGPQIPFLAGRPFAAGLPAWMPGYYQAPGDLARARRRLDREQVSTAVLLEGTEAFERAWPDLAEWFHSRRYEEHALLSDDAVVRVWIPAAAPGTPIDSATGLPCHAQ